MQFPNYVQSLFFPNFFKSMTNSNFMKLEFDKKKCIGSGACVAQSPYYFQLRKDEGKAELQHSQEQEDDVYVADVEEGREQEAIEAAAACPVNAIKGEHGGRVLVSNEVETDKMKEVKAEYDDMKEFTLDPKGYFLIRVNREKQRVEVGHCGERNEVDVMVYGNTAIEIYMTIIKKGLVGDLGHAAYLGREIEKACLALKHGLKYVQDDELEI